MPPAPSAAGPAPRATPAPSALATPAFTLVYGPSGVGKSVDQGRAFPGGLFLAAPGALTSIPTTLGYDVANAYAGTIGEATQVVLREAKAKTYTAIICDDFSFLAQQTLDHLENVRRLSGFKLWGALGDEVLSFREACRFSGLHIALSCWEQVPTVKPDGTRLRGGPQLSGKLPEAFSAMCDLVLRCAHEPMRKPWPTVYRCAPLPDWVMKDRFNVVPDPAPMNLGEILRMAGYAVPRHPGLPWQEEIVEQLAQQLCTGEPAQDSAVVNDAYAKLRHAGIAGPFAKFTVSDALDRANLRRAQATRYATFN